MHTVAQDKEVTTIHFQLMMGNQTGHIGDLHEDIGTFLAVRLPAQGEKSPQRCFRHKISKSPRLVESCNGFKRQQRC
jgi:hypothetical protein